ncbi:MAG: hypothetical protein ABW139_02155 [Candidatus Thiodiazotropha sp. DIVDIV]
MSLEKRVGLGPIPNSPEMYINEKQVDGMSILKKFGWKLICIRRAQTGQALTLLKNRLDKTVGVLGEDGILRLQPEIKIRHSRYAD